MQSIEPYIDIINVFLVYYKRKNKNEDVMSKLKEIDYTKDTFKNKFMNVFLDKIEKEKKNEKHVKKVTIFDLDDEEEINNYNYMYVLEINKKEHKQCHTLLPLIRYVSLIPEWSHIDWKIYKLKSI